MRGAGDTPTPTETKHPDKMPSAPRRDRVGGSNARGDCPASLAEWSDVRLESGRPEFEPAIPGGDFSRESHTSDCYSSGCPAKRLLGQRWDYPRRRNVTTSVVGLRNGHIRKNLTKTGEAQRDIYM